MKKIINQVLGFFSAKIVVCIGDSITAGWPYGSYPTELAKILKGFGSYKVENAGSAGEKSGATVARFKEALKKKPHLIVLGIGTNNMTFDKTVEGLRTDLIQMCMLAKNANVKLLLLGMPDWLQNSDYSQITTDHIVYANVAKAQGVPLQSGGYRACLAEPLYYYDGIHLNPLGYQAYAYHVGQAIFINGLL